MEAGSLHQLFQFLRVLASTCHFLSLSFGSGHLSGRDVAAGVLICISLMTEGVGTFSCASWPFVYLLGDVCSNFKLGCLIFVGQMPSFSTSRKQS